MKNDIEIYSEKRAVMPLKSWDIYSQFSLAKLPIISEKEQEVKQLLYFYSKYKWKTDVQSILKQSTYDALVLTDFSKKILWVNNGFSKMTGYTKEFAKNKKPSFLQGKDTSKEKVASIRKKLLKDIPFKEVIINYKKDGTPYKCEVHIVPLRNSDKTVHYLALEKAV